VKECLKHLPSVVEAMDSCRTATTKAIFLLKILEARLEQQEKVFIIGF
jgi:hypothetical protein